MNRSSGFTLLELMVVIVIVAMLFTFMALSIRTGSYEDLLEEEALRLNRLVQLLIDESILRNEDFGIAFSADKYSFLRYEFDDELGDGSWKIISDDRLFRERTLPESILIDLKLENSEIDMTRILKAEGEGATPQVFVLSSGEITPDFEVDLFIPTEPVRYRVIASVEGKHRAEAVR